MKQSFLLLFYILITCISFSCKKEQEVFEDNTPPPYSGVSTLEVQNYVNRVFIDLIGREPLNSEMEMEVNFLEANDLSKASRSTFIQKIQSNKNLLPNDSSYFVAYFNKVYEDTKARLLEGSSDDYIQGEINQYRTFASADSTNGDFVGYELNTAEADKLQNILKCQFELRDTIISPKLMYSRMMLSSIYDEINMNSFNFINAVFDDCYNRFPTQDEFEASFSIIENNDAGQILGEVAQNKTEYLEVIVNNPEFDEGIVTWAFRSLLNREPKTNEALELSEHFNTHESIPYIQEKILITDEYAGF
jgi:hypothetical protein